MSLAGAQDKLPEVLIEGHLAIPVNGTPSTHILKSDTRRLPGSVQNEALCLVLASRIGHGAAKMTAGSAGNRSCLLMTRYDRVPRNGKWLRLHQEDFCQALGKPPWAKYEHNQSDIKGSGLADFSALARHHLPPADILRLRDAVILNILLTNVDAHAKNYSLLLLPSSARLAPLYDVMYTSAWPDILRNLSQDVGGQNRACYLAARHWRRMAKECGLNGIALLHRIKGMAAKIPSEIEATADAVRAMPAGDHPYLAEFIGAIKAQCLKTRDMLRQTGRDGSCLIRVPAIKNFGAPEKYDTLRQRINIIQ